MSNLTEQVTNIHKPMDRTWLKVLSLALGFYHVAMLMWEPEMYGQSIGGFNAIIVPMMIWAMCSSMVFGVGFKPIKWYWQVLFSPYFSLAILSYLLVVRIM